jgi:hypothetical protein
VGVVEKDEETLPAASPTTPIFFEIFSQYAQETISWSILRIPILHGDGRFEVTIF